MMGQIRNEREEKKFLSFIGAVFRLKDEKHILNALDGIDIPRPYGLKIKVVYSPNDPVSVIESMAKGGLIEQISLSTHVFLYKSKTLHVRGIEINTPFLVTTLPVSEMGSRVAAIVSICNRDGWRILKRLFANQYPQIVPILLSQHELLNAIEELKIKTRCDVRITSRSAKENLKVGKRKERKSVREWTDETLEEMCRTIEERGQILTSVDAEFYQTIDDHAHITPKAICKIRKDGEIEVSGSFKLAYDSVALYIASVGDKKLRFYDNRGLREANYKPKPLSINYSQPVFEDLATVRSLVTTLTKYRNSMHTVIHGNPYMHVRITDLHDGSSFEIWAIPPKRLAIVPGLKATEAAVGRLIHFIFEGFREGKVESYGEKD
ncbi:MAG TPA: hypothetical protein PLI09_08790 [Candidatus Hydrogenedentes bacterium]|nr:hypothetical protein [Candidatus Hydrogenedentota bacterium]